MSTLEQQEANVLNEPVANGAGLVEDIVENQMPNEQTPQELAQQDLPEETQDQAISVDYEAEAKKFQSMYDRSQAENAKLQQGAQILQLLEQRPDLVQKLQDGIANPEDTAKQEPGLKEDDFNPWETFKPGTVTGDYVANQLNSQMENIVNKKLAQQQQQMQAEMQLNNTVGELRSTYKMSDNDIRDFLSFTTQPKEQVGLNNLVKLWQMQNGQSVANNDTIQAVNAAKQAPRTAGVLQGQAPQTPKTDTDNMFDGILNSGSGARLP